MNPVEMVAWAAGRAGLGRFRATIELLCVAVLSSMQDRRNTLKMQRIDQKMQDPRSLINGAPENFPYRNEREIENLFKRLGIPLRPLRAFVSCQFVQI